MILAELSPTEAAVGFAVCAACIFFSGLYSGAETGLYCVSRLRLSVAAHRKNKRAMLLQGLLQNRPDSLATVLIGTNIANYLAPLCMAYLILKSAAPTLTEKQAAASAEFYTTVILTPIVFIFGEIVPKNLFQRHADRIMPYVARVLDVSRRLFRIVGLIGLQRWIGTLFLKRTASPSTGTFLGSRAQMYQLLHEGAAEGNLSRTQIDMLESAHKLRGIPITAVMVPLSRIVMLRSDMVMRDIRGVIQSSRHSRLPVYSGDRKKIVGVVHLLDLIYMGEDDRVDRVIRKIPRVSAQTTVLDTLAVLQQKRRRIAAIEDAAGNCLGIVTVKDLAEELIGEITAW